MAEMTEITDFAASQLDVYARLSEVQLRRYRELECGIFIAESPKVITRALDAGYTADSFLAEQGKLAGETGEVLARCPEIPVYTAPKEMLTELTGFSLTRGLLCAMNRRRLPTVEQICAGARRIVVLEHVVNPTNVGAIFRSAAALHMDAVLLTPDCSDPLYRRAARVSMGTVFQIPWTYLDDETMQTDKRRPEAPHGQKQWQEVLRDFGFKTAAMALCEDTVCIDDPRLAQEEKLAIVLGTEGDGLAPQTIADCDYTVKIPMSHGVDSLNVAAASAVAFWELGKQQSRS